MNQAINDFYNNSKLYDEIKILDNTVDFSENGDFVSKSGIKKNLKTDSIEIILDLVKMGKIDPWNIDIVDLYDKYMLRIKELKLENLQSIGKALLFSSTLLKIKSDILNGISVNDFELEPEDYFIDDGMMDDSDYEQMHFSTSNIVSFDEALQRRTSVRLNRKRSVTLKDLIRHIQFYEDLEKKYAIKQALNSKERRVRNYANLDAAKIKNIAHDESVQEMVDKMHQNLNQIFEHEDKIEIRELTVLGFTRASAFVALLFLVRDKVIELEQDEFYGELFARKYGNIDSEAKEE